MSDKKRLLNDLRVIDLRAELEKRNLDKSGVRGVLITRLTKYLQEEGHDPETFKFDLAPSEKNTPSKRSRRTESSVEQETEETPQMEDMIVQDDAADDDEAEQAEAASEGQEPNEQSEDTMEVAPEKVNRKRELKEDSEATEAKKPKEDIDNDEENKAIENNTDAEDSINLDIGDDELLNEETDNTIKLKKDEAGDAAAAAAAGDATPGDDGAATHHDQQESESGTQATSNDNDDSKDKDQSDDKDKEEGDKKDKKDENKESGARNLWVSGLSGDTRAKDLKQLCSKHGKVIGAKVVTNARTPGSRCYGYVTMASAADAESCIKNLHRTELHGRMISVEKAKSEAESSARRQPARHERRTSREAAPDHDKDAEDGKENVEKASEPKVKKEGEASGDETNRSTSRSKDKTNRSDKEKARRSTRSRERRRSPREVLSFSKIWKERDIARARERSRAAREEERRRRAAEEALRERERRQRQEKHRLAIEREKLRSEREKIEREKNELLRLERERHRLEREKLELERLELKRAQLRLEEERRKPRGYEGGGGAYRKASPGEAAYERDPRHKRAAPPAVLRHDKVPSSRQFDAPPPPRFEMPAPAYEHKRDRDYKRDYPRHAPSSNISKYPSNGSSAEEARQPVPPGTHGGGGGGAARKEAARSYEARDSRVYRPSPPGKPEARWAAARYGDAPAGKGSSGAGDSWPSSSGGGGGGGSDARYAGYEPRYGPAYQPPPPGAASYPERYAAPRDYRKY